MTRSRLTSLKAATATARSRRRPAGAFALGLLSLACSRASATDAVEEVDIGLSRPSPAGPTSPGYRRTPHIESGKPLAWEDPSVHLHLYGGTDDRWAAPWIVQQVEKAARLWSAVPCSRARLSVEIVRGRSGVAAADGESALVFRDRLWCPEGGRKRRECWPPEVPAVTTVRPEGRFDARSEVAILEADIEVNAVHYRWRPEPSAADEPGPARPAPASLAHVLVHEMGHVLGLDDVCRKRPMQAAVQALPACNDVPEALRSTAMFPEPSEPFPSPRLGAADRAFLCRVYPRH